MSDKQKAVENRVAFEKFDDFLQLRRKEIKGEDGTDIREKVLSARKQPRNIGYVDKALDGGFGNNLGILFPDLRPYNHPQFGEAESYVLLGTVYGDPQHSHGGAVASLQSFSYGDDLLLAEQGFLSSTHSWSESFRGRQSVAACLGYVYDDISYYFMADYPNRLIHRLNSDISLDVSERRRARALIDRIATKKISKYNSQPIMRPTMSEGYSRRVLVCDQSFADASTIFGKIDEEGFEQMLLAAIRENPDAEILVKTHPDTFWEKGKRVGYYNHLQDTGRLRILRSPINPYSLFDCVDKVYVGTSQIGLEALFAGKEVVCFGAPFYAGWGLTDDRQEIPHRHRTRSLEEIFHFFYIWYTIYHVPGAGEGPSEIEQVLDFIEEKRPTKLRELAPPPAQPKVSVIMPVYGVEKFVERAIQSVQEQTMGDFEILMVNDRSPDGSQDIIDRMAAEDSRIRPVILKQNMGQGMARNAGIEMARGDYVFFLDSDDILSDEHVLQSALDAALEDGSEMVRVQKRVFEDGKILTTLRLDGAEKHFPDREILANAGEDPKVLKSWHFWLYLYKRELLDTAEIRFATPQWEERAFVCKALRNTNQVTVLPVPGVSYRKRPGSTMRRQRTRADLTRMITNIELTADAMQGTPSLVPTGTQSAVALLEPTWAQTILNAIGEDGPESAAVFERLAGVFEKYDMLDAIAGDTEELSYFVPKGSDKLTRAALFVAALVTRNIELVRKLLGGEPFEQAFVMRMLLEEPQTTREAALQAAFNQYARNERVQLDAEVVEAGRASTPKPRIVVHVGSTKTGSTFVQHFLEKNRAALLRAGIWYPEVGLFWQKNRPHKQAGHAPFVPEAVKKGEALKSHIEAGLALAEGRIHTIILSSEAYFLNRRSVMIADHFSDYPVEMIGYFRRQDDWANSQYAEFVAGGAVGRVAAPLSDWIADEVTQERLDYFSYCQLWASRVGHDRVRARLYERSKLKNGDIVSDFLDTLGLSEFDHLPRPSSAQSNDFPFNEAHVDIIRRLNQYEWKDSNRYLEFIEEVSRSVEEVRQSRGAPKPKVSILTEEERQALMASLQEVNSRFGVTFCNTAGSPFKTLPVKEKVGASGATICGNEVSAIFSAFDKYGQSKLDGNKGLRNRPQKTKLPTDMEIKETGAIYVDFLSVPESGEVGAELSLDMSIFNLADFRLPSSAEAPKFSMSYHIMREDGGRFVWNGLRTELTVSVAHDHTAPVRVLLPSIPGRYLLQAALVYEAKRWFNSHITHPITVHE